MHPNPALRIPRQPRTSRIPWARAAFAGLALSAIAALGLYATAGEAASQPPLGTAQSFAVLAGAGITNTGSTTITGDVGSFPTTTQSGFASVTLNGANHGGDAVTQGAKNSLVTAYVNAAGQGPVTTIPTELGGSTLIPGAYDSSAGTFGITGTLTLNGQGDPDAVFIFKMDSSLTTAAGSNVNLIGSARACNVFWQVGSSATLGANSTFRGNILALTSISLTTGASISGRALARNGAVTLQSNTITATSCESSSESTPESTGATNSGGSGDSPRADDGAFLDEAFPGTPATVSPPATVAPPSGLPPATGVETPVPAPPSRFRPPSTGDAGLLHPAAPAPR